jgi:hypothetical protein
MYEWVWSIGGMLLTGETEVLGEKHYTALVVDVWMSMEHWWNDTVRGNWSTGRETCHSANFSTKNATWIDLGLNPGLNFWAIARPVNTKWSKWLIALSDRRHGGYEWCIRCGAWSQFELPSRSRSTAGVSHRCESHAITECHKLTL